MSDDCPLPSVHCNSCPIDPGPGNKGASWNHTYKDSNQFQHNIWWIKRPGGRKSPSILETWPQPVTPGNKLWMIMTNGIRTWKKHPQKSLVWVEQEQGRQHQPTDNALFSKATVYPRQEPNNSQGSYLRYLPWDKSYPARSIFRQIEIPSTIFRRGLPKISFHLDKNHCQTSDISIWNIWTLDSWFILLVNIYLIASTRYT